MTIGMSGRQAEDLGRLAQPQLGTLEPERIDAALLQQAQVQQEAFAGDFEHRI